MSETSMYSLLERSELETMTAEPEAIIARFAGEEDHGIELVIKRTTTERSLRPVLDHVLALAGCIREQFDGSFEVLLHLMRLIAHGAHAQKTTERDAMPPMITLYIMACIYTLANSGTIPTDEWNGLMLALKEHEMAELPTSPMPSNSTRH